MQASRMLWSSAAGRRDSLRLFTPARYNALPGSRVAAAAGSFPSKDEFADYLEGYARQFRLPVRTGVAVEHVGRANGVFEVHTSEGTIRARSVVASPGYATSPRIPDVAERLDPDLTQLHSSAYRSPAGVPAGDVVVVGAGPSGAQIALELARAHPSGIVYLAGRPTVHIPDAVFRFAGPAYWRFVNSVLTLATRPGRRVAASFHDRGAPLISVSMQEVERAGVVRLPRLSRVVDGRPVFDGGAADNGVGNQDRSPSPADLRTIIWATGYRPDLDWIEDLPVTAYGWPVSARGVVPEVPGLYFVGMPFQYALTSGLIGGVGRDAAHVVAQLVAHRT